MVVSEGLQKYFDAQRDENNIESKLSSLSTDLDPRFLQSFSEYRSRILWIVQENPEAEEMISNEVIDLGEKLTERKRQHNMKKAAVVIDTAEAA